jgi:hypothetical protein
VPSRRRSLQVGAPTPPGTAPHRRVFAVDKLDPVLTRIEFFFELIPKYIRGPIPALLEEFRDRLGLGTTALPWR